jgi:DNA-binding SARP family transcriptional activator
MIRLRVLGTIDLRREDGSAIDAVLRQPKRAALLTYLAASHGGVPRRRDVIVAMFWPEADDRHARDALSAGLGFLRRNLGPGAITVRGEQEIGCDPRHVLADVAEFLRVVEEHRDEEVLSLYGGELLPGLYVQDAPGFGEWLERERARLRALATASAGRLAERAAAARMLEAATAYARRATELAPDDEKLLRRLISLEAAAGNRAAALRTYEGFAAHVATEYDAEPSPETIALVAAIRIHGPTSHAASATDGDALGAREVAQLGAFEEPRTTSHPDAPVQTGLRQPVVFALSVLVIALVAVLAALNRRDTLTASGGVPLIVVADFSATDTVLGVTTAAWLRSTLGRTPGVRSLEGAELAEALRRMRRDPMRPLDDSVARELAIREGASGVVSGRITETESGRQILTQLVRDDGRVLVRPTTMAASSADVLPALVALGERLRGSIVTSGHSRSPLGAVTTPSLGALIAYTEGDRLRYNALDSRAAIPYYERAIRLDSTFAMAYSQLGGAWNELGSAAPTPDTVGQLWRTAMRFADGLSPRELLAIRDRMIFAGPGDPTSKFDEAVRLYQDHLRLNPDDGPALQNLSWYLKHVGRWADSETPALQALRTGYQLPGVYDELVLAQIAGTKFKEAERSLRAWRARFGPSQLWYRDAFRLAAARRDYVATDSLTAEATRDRTWNVQPGQLPVVTLAIRGRLREAEALQVKQMAMLEQSGNYGALIRATSWFAAIRAGVTGDTAVSLAMLRNVLQRHPPKSLSGSGSMHIYKDAGRHLALLGDTAGARAMLASLQDNWYFYRIDYNLRGLIYLAAGRYPETITELGQVRYSSGQLPSLGHAYEAVGATDSAIAVYERFLVEPDPDSPAWDAVFLVHVLERLGHLYASKGENGLAAARYGLVAKVLEEADPDLQWRARRARELAAHERSAVGRWHLTVR